MNGDRNTSPVLRTESVHLQRPSVHDEDLNEMFTRQNKKDIQLGNSER